MAEPRILVGPLYDPKLIGRFRHASNILTFRHDDRERIKSHQYDLVYNLFALNHFNDIFSLLPTGWEPDLVIWWDSIYQPLPRGIEDCPYPTALIPGDWNLAFQTILNLAPAFDVILTDKRLKAILEQHNLTHCLYWRCFSFDSESLVYDPNLEQTYDIGFVGNLNEQIHPQRSAYLDQILHAFSNKYQLHFSQGVWGDAYRQVLNQSKIVFNYTICQVLNMRAFEAPACGALLFIEDENFEVRDVFQDRENCVLYNRDNLIPLLAYYLENEDERKRIAKNGYDLVQNYSSERIFEDLIRRVPEILDLASTSKRKFKQKPDLEKNTLYLRQLACSGSTGLSLAQTQILPLLNSLNLADLAPQDSYLLNTAVFLFFPIRCLEEESERLSPKNKQILEQVKLWIDLALQVQKDNPLLYYHRALTLECLGEIKAAMWNYSYCVELQAKQKYADLFEMQLYILPFLRQQASHFIAVEWSRASYELDKPQALRLRYIKLLNSYIWSRLAVLLNQNNQTEKSLIAYENALENFVNPIYYIQMAKLKVLQGKTQDAWNYFSEGLRIQPFLIRYLSEWLTPKIIVEYWEELLDYIQPYQTLKQFDLNFYHVLCKLCQDLTQRLPLPEIIQSLENYFSPKLYSWISPILEAFVTPENQTLLNLNKPCKTKIKLPLEQFPSFEQETGFVYALDETSDLILTINTNQPRQEKHFERVYSQSTNWEKHQIGPDFLPYFFPAFDPDWEDQHSILEDIWDSTGLPILILYQALSLHQILSFLSIFENYNLSHPNLPVYLILWSPEGTEKELNEIASQISEDLQTQIIVLPESLSRTEQAYLLSRSEFILSGTQRNSFDFYHWWALFLGTPLYLLGNLSNPYLNFGLNPDLKTSKLDKPEEIFEHLQHWPAAKKQFDTIRSQLIHFYHHQAYTAFMKAFWKMRLTLLQQKPMS